MTPSLPEQYYLDVNSVSFTPEDDDDPDGPHINEFWRLEFVPRDGKGLPRENVIFVLYNKNYQIEDAFENVVRYRAVVCYIWQRA